MTREELIESLTLLKEQARNSGSNTFVWDIKIDSFNFVIDSAIKALDQEPKTGHWLMPDKNYSPKIWRKCSCCGTHLEKFTKHISFDGDVNYIENIMNYCRICGADMREVEDENIDN